MFPWIRGYSHDQTLDCFLAVTLGVALVSSAAWLVARCWSGNAALRRLVLLSALLWCLALPVAAWLGNAAGVALVSVPLLRTHDSAAAPVVEAGSADWESPPPEPLAHPAPAAEGAASPRTSLAAEASARAAVAADSARARSAPPRSAPASQKPAAALSSYRGIAAGAMFVWAGGALLLMARLAWNAVRIAQLRRWSRPLRSRSHESLMREVAATLGMRRTPRLLVSSRLVSPLAIGWESPTVLLPDRLLGAISDEELRDILTHEAAHLQRGDPRIVLLQALAGAAYWPVLSVHGLNRELRRALEEVCDNVVLASRDAISYGRTLLRVAELLAGARPVGAAAGVVGGPGELERRIAGLIDPGRKVMTRASRKAALSVALLFLVAGAMASATRFVASADAAPPSPPKAAAAPDLPADSDDVKRAGSFHGRVAGPDGKPLRGAQVLLVPSGKAIEELGPVRAETDDQGRFAFVAPDMTYTGLDGLAARRQGLLIAMADGYAPDWMTTWGQTRSSSRSHWDPIKGADLNLQLGEEAPMHGQFLDADGRPLAGALVRLTQLMIPRGRDLDAYLDREAKRNIVAADLDYERSISRPHLLPRLETETRTDAEGRFTLSGLGRDRLAVLSVSAPSVVHTTLKVMTREAPDVPVRLDFQGKATSVIYGAGFTLSLERGLTVTGVVRDRDTGEPIPGMWVGMMGDSPLNGLKTGEYFRATDVNGRFTISGLRPELLDWREAFRRVTAVSPPGMPYETASATVERDAELIIECRRGIPFRLKLLDEQGEPVAAEVTYVDVSPNPHSTRSHDTRWPISRAAQQADGTWKGFVLPGPGAVLVKAPGRAYRPAFVDPKAFFAPGRTEWTAQEQISTYGTRDSLSSGGGWINQHDYQAILLVNPQPGAGPLELSATLVKDIPRRVSLIDPDGQPVVGAKPHGMTFHPHDFEPPLRTASFLLRGLHPDRVQRITFVHEDRGLIGFLMARGDGEAPYVVRMQPWGALTGRIVDEKGRAFPHQGPNGKRVSAPSLAVRKGSQIVVNTDPQAGEHARVTIDAGGKFRVDQLVPGQRYTGRLYRGIGRFVGLAFEDLVLRPGEVRDLGEIRTQPPAELAASRVAAPPRP